MNLWDYSEAAAARDAGIAKVEEKSAPWRAVAYDVLCQIARKRETLTSDDLMEELDRRGIPRPIDARACGPVMLKGIKNGVIVSIGFVEGRNPKHHLDVARLYRSGLL